MAASRPMGLRKCPGLPELHGWSGLGPEKGPFRWQAGSRPCPAHPVGWVKCSEGTGGQAMSELLFFAYKYEPEWPASPPCHHTGYSSGR